MKRQDPSVSFVAEVSSNHHQDLNRCLRFIDEAARIGCNAVKFQLFRLRDLFAPEILEDSPDHRKREAWELPPDFLPDLARHTKKHGMEFSCTPFYLEAVTELEPYVDFYKVASYELIWDDLLVACARTSKPVVISTGMAELEEVKHAVAVLEKNGCRNITVLHCVSSYPAPGKECNLAAIATLREETGHPVGWSDHSLDPGIIHRAVHRWGAKMVEFHMDLDGQGGEYSTGHCWLPDEMGSVVRAIRHGLEADGDGRKVPAPSELPDREWRSDPNDGLRPLRSMREKWVGERALRQHRRTP